MPPPARSPRAPTSWPRDSPPSRRARVPSGASETLAQGVGGLAGGAVAAADASDTLAQGLGGLATGAEAAADPTRSPRGWAAWRRAPTTSPQGPRNSPGPSGRPPPERRTSPARPPHWPGRPQATRTDQLEPLIGGGEQIEAGLLEAAARIGSPSDPVLDLIAPLPPDDDTTCSPGGTAPPDDDCVTIYQGVRALRDGLAAVDAVAAALEGRVDAARRATLEGLGSISDDVSAAAKGAAELYASVCGPPRRGSMRTRATSSWRLPGQPSPPSPQPGRRCRTSRTSLQRWPSSRSRPQRCRPHSMSPWPPPSDCSSASRRSGSPWARERRTNRVLRLPCRR